jgi:hypothetical protein
MRVFVPATFDDLRALARDRVVPAGRPAVGVTAAFRESYASGDDEELSYAALAAAAALSVPLVAQAGGEARRVVLACDTDDVTPATGGTPGGLLLTADVPIARVAALHVDDADVDLGDAEGYELMWFATQELDTLL